MHRKTRIKAFYLTSLLCLFALLLAACGGSTAPGNSNSGNQPEAASPDKQVLRQISETGDFDTLDPALTNTNGDPINILFTGLVAPRADGTIVDQLASSHDVSADGLTYTFKLKPNLKFSDGTPLTADDVAYSINRTILPATKSNVSGYLQLIKDFDQVNSGKLPTLIGDSLIVKDPQTISIVISKPAAYFLQALAYPTSYVVEKKIVEKYGGAWTDHLNEGGGDGPFKVQSYSHTAGLVLVPNTNYYGAQPKLQKMQYAFGNDRDANYNSFKAGQYDITGVPPSQDEIAKKQPGYQLTPALASRFIGMNYLAKPLDNIKIRQALALAINKDLVIRHIIGPNVTPSNHIVPKGIPGYNSNLKGPAGVAGTSGDQAKAKQLLQQGLQEGGYSGVDKLPSISLTYSVNYKAGADTMTAIADEWKQVLGISVKLVGVQGNDLVKQEGATVGHEGPLQMWYGIWNADYPDPQDWLTLFFGKGSDHNTFNYGQNSSTDAVQQQAVQDQMARADGEKDQATRFKLYNDAEQKIVDSVGWITTYQTVFISQINPKLQNYKTPPLGFLATDDWSKVYFSK